jgi:hypothetical protein
VDPTNPTLSASLPVGVRESIQRVDEDLAVVEASAQALIDLVHHDGVVPPALTSFLKSKHALLGHLRRDFGTVPERMGGTG